MVNPNDELHAMWMEQADHWRREWERYGKPTDINALHLRLCHHLHGEVDELLRCADWKIHARGERASKRKVTFECVDLWKFLLTMMLLHDISPREFTQAFLEKSQVVRGRVRLEVLKDSAPGPLFVCDIDGVLCDRDPTLIEFARRDHGATYPHLWSSIREFKCTYGQKSYEYLKQRFYEDGGFERCQPIHANLDALAQQLPPGMPVLLVTSRDIERYPRLEYETHRWLERCGIHYDGLIFASEKERAITWVDRRSVAIDDEEEHVGKMTLVCDSLQYTGPESMSEACALARAAMEERNAPQPPSADLARDEDPAQGRGTED